MFNCLSRKERPQTFQLKKNGARAISTPKQIQPASIKKEQKSQSTRETTMQLQKNLLTIPLQKNKMNYNVINFEESPRQTQQINQSIMITHTPKFLQQIVLQQNLILQKLEESEEKIQNQVNFRNSITSFKISSQENSVKEQIQKALQNITNYCSFFPKNYQSSLEGMYKEQSTSSIPSQQMNELQHNQMKINRNQEFSKQLILCNFNEAYEIFKKMDEKEKNGYDQKGYTPIYLATLMSIYKSCEALNFLKLILKDKEIDPSKKTAQGFKPLQQTILYKSIPTLTNVFRYSYLHKISQIKKSLQTFAQALSTLPDLQLQLYISVGSFLPLMDKIAPNDTIKIYKKGEHLRIDYSLVGYSFLQSKRRSMSCTIQKLPNNEYTVMIINHDKGCYTDLLQPFTNQELVLIIEDLLSNQVKRINPQVQSACFKEEYNIFNELIKQFTPYGPATKHQLKVNYTSRTQKLKPRSRNAKDNFSYLNSVEDYQSYIPPVYGSKKKKQLKLGVWTCKKYPLQMHQLLQIMKFLSFSHQTGQIVYNFLSNEKIQKSILGFPIKIQIPMSFTFYLDIQITNLNLGSPSIQFNYHNKYEQMKRMCYQKTLYRQEKRNALLKFYM